MQFAAERSARKSCSLYRSESVANAVECPFLAACTTPPSFSLLALSLDIVARASAHSADSRMMGLIVPPVSLSFAA